MTQSQSAPRELVVAVPKGRVLDQLGPRLEAAGLDPAPLYAKGRELIRVDRERGIRYLLLKPDDVPTWVEYGAADLGIVGRDVLLEREYDLYAPVDLGIGRCRMMVCGKPGQPVRGEGGRTLRVATKFMNIAARHFREKGVAVELIYVQGSVELAPLTGLADVIVDLVETGETLRANGLSPLEPICEISSVVVANRASLKLERERIAPLLERLAARG
ncbi:MAG: ATP phosphoribosyltransferase [Myxococcales bacterium]|jgi:ATP phosphoribosyltransferase|nr:ATP phosphoribosyltransferase [Myxococcales bacterium]